MSRKRDKEDFVKAITENENLIHKITHIYASIREEREDLKQEIIYQLWKSWKTFRHESKIQTWMYRVALNSALFYRNKPRLLKTQLDENKINPAVYNPDFDHVSEVEQLFRAIKKLNELDQAIIMLWLEKLKYKEIGEITGLSEKNISVKIHRIKSKLKELIEL